jgi:hypothetical protein
MGKILIISSCNEDSQLHFVETLKHILRGSDFSFECRNEEIFTNKNLLESNCYDLIIAINRKALELSKQRKNTDTPTLYIIFNSNIHKEFISDSSLFNELIIVNNQKNDYSNFFSQNITTITNYPIIKNDSLKTNCTNNILIHTNNTTILNITKTINNLYDYNIAVYSNDSPIDQDIFNSHITVIKKSDVDNYIKKSRLLIGSGEIVMKSIQLGIESFVIGEYGFGGKVTETNIDKHISNFFSGRIGASKGEYIPGTLVYNEIMNAMRYEYNNEDMLNLRDNLTRYQETIYSKINNVICRIINNNKLSIWNKSLIFNDMFRIIKSNEHNSYLIDNRFEKICFELDKIELEVVEQFTNATNLDEVFNKLTTIDKSFLKELTESFILNKILVYNE